MDTEKYQYGPYNQIKKSVPGSEGAAVKKILKRGEEVQGQAGFDNYEKAKNNHYEKPGKATLISVVI